MSAECGREHEIPNYIVFYCLLERLNMTRFKDTNMHAHARAGPAIDPTRVAMLLPHEERTAAAEL